jgi:hypothetical protein
MVNMSPLRAIGYLDPRTLCLTAAVGILSGVAAWLFLPFPARITVADVGLARDGDPGGPQLAFSRDCRLVASTHGEGGGDGARHRWQGELRVWDTHQRRMLFAVAYEEHGWPWDGGYSLAFTPKGDKLVAYSWGKTKFYLIPSGAPWEPDVKHVFPCGAKGGDDDRGAPAVRSRLVTDAAGNLFVFVRDLDKKKITIRDLWTAKETATWDADPPVVEGNGTHSPLQDLGGVLLEVHPPGPAFPGGGVLRVRELPSGKLHPPLEKADLWPGYYEGPLFAATPDGRTVVALNGSGGEVADTGGGPVRVWIDGTQNQLQLIGTWRPALSPDGRLLAAYAPCWLRATYGIGPRDYFVISDLTTGRALAHLPNARFAHFSFDGKTLAALKIVHTRDFAEPDLSLDLYDLPLRPAWGKIIGTALACASVVLVVGQWLRWRRKRNSAAAMPPPAPAV